MKQQDVAILIIVVFFAGVSSFFLSSKVVKTDKSEQTAEVVTAITAEFPVPPSEIFNDQAINPTAIIEIGPNQNNQPFKQQE